MADDRPATCKHASECTTGKALRVVIWHTLPALYAAEATRAEYQRFWHPSILQRRTLLRSQTFTQFFTICDDLSMLEITPSASTSQGADLSTGSASTRALLNLAMKCTQPLALAMSHELLRNISLWDSKRRHHHNS